MEIKKKKFSVLDKVKSTGKSISEKLPKKSESKGKTPKKAVFAKKDKGMMPKNPVLRFFAHLHPKRVAKFVFSKRGLFFFLKAFAAMFLIGIIVLGGLFLYYKKDLESIRLDEMKVSESVNARQPSQSRIETSTTTKVSTFLVLLVLHGQSLPAKASRVVQL